MQKSKKKGHKAKGDFTRDMVFCLFSLFLVVQLYLPFSWVAIVSDFFFFCYCLRVFMGSTLLAVFRVSYCEAICLSRTRAWCSFRIKCFHTPGQLYCVVIGQLVYFFLRKLAEELFFTFRKATKITRFARLSIIALICMLSANWFVTCLLYRNYQLLLCPLFYKCLR